MTTVKEKIKSKEEKGTSDFLRFCFEKSKRPSERKGVCLRGKKGLSDSGRDNDCQGEQLV